MQQNNDITYSLSRKLCTRLSYASFDMIAPLALDYLYDIFTNILQVYFIGAEELYMYDCPSVNEYDFPRAGEENTDGYG